MTRRLSLERLEDGTLRLHARGWAYTSTDEGATWTRETLAQRLVRAVLRLLDRLRREE